MNVVPRSLTLGLVAAMALAVPATAQREAGESPQDIKSQEKESVVFACDDDGDNEIIFHGDLKMWPPNHKYQDLSITALDNADNNSEINLMTRVTHDEYVGDFEPTDDQSDEEQTDNEEVGSGHTANDASPFLATDSNEGDENFAATEHDVRSERSGRGDGRTYTISADAMFDGESCSTEFEVEVPHDMRSANAPAKEDKTDSTGPNQDD